jgi:hypothetical protein
MFIAATANSTTYCACSDEEVVTSDDWNVKSSLNYNFY